MTVVVRITRTPKAFTITIGVDSANTIAFDAVDVRIYES